jgi:sugar O-acyltransferase (sialic acid O-acetyltransferase NeuD family)
MAVSLILVVGVASPYAWDVVESAWRGGFDAHCVDNFGGADPRLPELVALEDHTSREDAFVIGLSSAEHRAAAAVALHQAGFARPFALVDTNSTLASTSEVGHGTFLNAGVVVASHTSVGCHSNINRSASIGHDNRIGFAASIGPGAVLTGGITIEAVASIGAGAVILPGRTIGRHAIVGAGAVVAKNVGAYEVVVGNPARVMRTIEPSGGDDTCPHC